MPTVTPTTVGAGLKSIFLGRLDTSGYFVGGLSVASAGEAAQMYRMRGALTLPTQLPQPQYKPVLGDDGVMATFVFEPTELPTGDVTFSVDDIDIEAFLQGTNVVQYGAEIDMGLQLPDSVLAPDVCILAHQRAKKITAGNSRWHTNIITNAQLSPRGSQMAHQAESTVTYGYTANKASRAPWGEAFSAVTHGSLLAGILKIKAPYPIMMVAATGDNAETTFDLPFTPVAETADAARCFVNGAALTYGAGAGNFQVSASAKTITFGTAPATSAKIIVFYQFLDTEL